SHSFKMGVDFLWEPVLGGFFLTDATPVISFFDDPLTILSNTTKYPQGFATPGAVQSIIQATTGNSYYAEHNKMFGLYFQDDWKLSGRWWLNLGIRWTKAWASKGAGFQRNRRAYLK